MAKRKIKLEADVLEFCVSIEVGDWRSERTVRITEPGIDWRELVRQIAAGATTVTRVDQENGPIYVSEAGRQFLAGYWTTDLSETYEDIVPTAISVVDDTRSYEELRVETLEEIELVTDGDEDGVEVDVHDISGAGPGPIDRGASRLASA